MDNIKILQIFDFDETLFRMPGYTGKIHVEEESLKFNTPYEFYDHPKSLCEKSHNIQLIEPVYSAWKKGNESSDVLSVLITHRIEELLPEINSILEKRQIEFDQMFLLGRKSEKIKTTFELIQKLPNLLEVQVYEDSIEQIYAYQRLENQLYRDVDYVRRPAIEFKTYIVDKSKIYRIRNVQISEEQRIKLI